MDVSSMLLFFNVGGTIYRYGLVIATLDLTPPATMYEFYWEHAFVHHLPHTFMFL